MIINIFKDMTLRKILETPSNQIRAISSKIKFCNSGEDYDLVKDRISAWFNPDRITQYPTSRCYPEVASEQRKPEYQIALYPANHLTLFLIKLLYNERKDVLIEDIGTGVGHLLVYLNYLGFNNFHVIENFSQTTQNVLDLVTKNFNVEYKLNQEELNPVIINNVGVNAIYIRKIAPETELIISYTNRKHEEWARNNLPKQGFKFLCKDQDDFTFAYCREDKYEEFKREIEKFEIKKNNPYRQYEPSFDVYEKEAICKYMDNPGFITEYKLTEQFEKEIARYLGVKHAIVVNNGTISLSLALIAAGIKAGDEVIVPNLTMIATANAVKLIGAKPILFDVDPSNLCLDIPKVREYLENRKVEGIIYVSLNGRWDTSGELMKLYDFCNNKGIVLIEDAAQSFGSHNYRGTIGKDLLIGSFSFSMPKIITTGQGGCLVTNNDYLATRLRELKDFGRSTGGCDEHPKFGINSKFTELQAILGLEQLKKIHYRTARKREMYKLYFEQLQGYPIEFIPTNLSMTVPWFVDIYVGQRDRLEKFLRDKEIYTRPIYPPIHTQKSYLEFLNTPVTTVYSSKGLWLPCSFNLKDEDIIYICNQIKLFFDSREE